MKKLFVFLAATVIYSAAANAQTTYVKNEIKSQKDDRKAIDKDIKKDRKVVRKLEGEEVSELSKEAFDADYPDASAVSWKRGVNYDIATFTQDGHPFQAFYDYNAELVGATSDKQFADLPEAAQKMINKKYPGYDKEQVIYYNDNGYNDTDMILFGTQFDDENNYFVELYKNGKRIVLEVTPGGDVSYFTAIK